MKKLFWIPLLAILTVIPMIAGAVPVAGEPVAGNADSATATVAPKYALKDAGAGDEKAALASYVKGAYNAVIKGINATSDEIDTLNSGIETYSDAIGHLTDGKATQSGTVATIKNATTTESINTSSVNINNVTTTSISATASGNINLSVPIMGDWTTDSLAENPIETTASFTNLPVENLTMSAPIITTATLTKTGITGNVDVSEYLASSAYTRLEYLQSTGTQYIDTGIVPTKNTKIEIRNIQIVKDTSFGVASQIYVFNTNDTNYYSFGGGSNSGSYTGASLVGLDATIVMSKDDGLVINGQQVVAFSDVSDFTTDLTFWLFARNTTTPNYKMGAQRTYYFKMWNNGTLVRNLIPVRRNSDNVLGMYDTVSGNFLTNAGTGEFVAGPELQ